MANYNGFRPMISDTHNYVGNNGAYTKDDARSYVQKGTGHMVYSSSWEPQRTNNFELVIEGLDVVHQIESVEVTSGTDSETTESSDSTTQEVSTPVNPPVITSIRVETYGVDYGLPETLTPFDYTSWLYQQYGIDPSSFATSE